MLARTLLKTTAVRGIALRCRSAVWARSVLRPSVGRTCGYATHAAHLTADTYPTLVRDARYKKLGEEDIAFFRGILSEQEILQAGEGEDLALYNEDWMRKYRGQSKLVLRPKSTQQVAAIIRYCNEQRLAVVPQGGNTGLVGGSVPVFDEIVLSLAQLNKVRDFDPVSGILKCDAGVILENADSYLMERGYLFPLDLGAKGSCHVGGLVATNAGGLRLLRYGSLHGSVLGLEVVLPNGEVLNSMDALRKDNTGFDLKQLFIGSEGTIGVITGVSILCPPRPTAFNVCFLALENYARVQEVFIKAKKELGEILSAFEFMDFNSQYIAGQHLKGVAHPFSEKYPFYVLIETAGSNKEHDDLKLEQFLEGAMEEGLVSDGALAQGETEVRNLWQWREMIPEASASEGGVYKYDVSLPLKDMHSLVDAVNERLTAQNLSDTEDASKPVVCALGYGHFGDGNLHLNVAVREYTKQVEAALEPFVYEFVASKHGSISAEHGLGFQKKNYISYSKSPQEIKMIKDIKHHYDPNAILNPYKYV